MIGYSKLAWLMIPVLVYGCNASRSTSQSETEVIQTDSATSTTDVVTVEPLTPRSQIIELTLAGASSTDECAMVGSVQDLSARTVIDSAVVTLDDGTMTTVTVNGRFQFSGITQGDHTLQVTRAGYMSLEEPVHFPPGTQVGVIVGLAAPPGN